MKKKKLLIVDDEPDILKLLSYRLEHAGYEVETASNGKEALDLLKKNPKIDLIILDLVMPIMDGTEFCHHLQKEPHLKKTPIILLSAASSSEKKAAKLKVSAYLIKPFDPKELLEHIEKALLSKD